MSPVLLLTLLLGGCSLLSNTRSTSAQLERVAKDWCQTIRASQVLCVYPLSEDVQVGDLYVVSTSIADEAKEYQRRGFLPFHTLLTRLQPVGYRDMYLDAYSTKDAYHILPHQWQFPPLGEDTTNWDAAPHAAFPSYTFAVKRGQALKLAVPVQAVPVGLSLMNAGNAQGSIEIADASTYGIDQRSLDAQVDKWASCPDVQALLKRYAPVKDKKGRDQTQYLRVITRVYVTGRVNVSLRNDEQRGLGADVGVAQDASLLEIKGDGEAQKRAAQNHAELLDRLNASINGAPAPAPAQPPAPATPAAATPNADTAPQTPAPMTSAAPAALAGTPAPPAAGSIIPKPGGSIRIAAATSRGITMSETFERPIVIGYIAYDRPISAGGRLGVSTSTLLRVEQKHYEHPDYTSEDNATIRSTYGADENTFALRKWLENPAHLEDLRTWLADQGKNPALVASYLNGKQFVELRQQIINAFGITGGTCGTGNQ